VCSKSGALRVVKNEVLLTKPFVKLTVSTSSEQGLLGIAFHPNFPTENWVYVYHTLPSKANRVSRFKADGDTALGGAAGAETIFEIPTGSGDNHDGGAIHFGNDGKLYVSSGNRADRDISQNINTTVGKILRLNPDGSIPTDNPFFAQTTGNARANWANGMRNTFTFAVDRVTGRIFGCEVGDGAEEVNELKGGMNYGYPKAEGYNPSADSANMVGKFQRAIYMYNGGCITGASFYAPTGTAYPGARNFPSTFHRKFFFSDLNHGYIKVLDIDNPKSVAGFATDAGSPVDIKFASNGVMYYVNRGTSGGSLFKVTHAGGTVGIEAHTIRPKVMMGRNALEILGLEHGRRFDGRSLQVPGTDR
jgi:glucose/arabinose dehydrogenase